MDTIFTTPLSPLADFFKDSGANIDKKAGITKLFLEDFFQKIVFGMACTYSINQKMGYRFNFIACLPLLCYSFVSSKYVKGNKMY
jgi:hypothetical protein